MIRSAVAMINFEFANFHAYGFVQHYDSIYTIIYTKILLAAVLKLVCSGRIGALSATQGQIIICNSSSCCYLLYYDEYIVIV